MSRYGDLAEELFFQGYNCAQSVFCAFCDVHGIDSGTAEKLSSSFGGGIGRLREVCGALTGVFMVLGMQLGEYDVSDIPAKTVQYRAIQALAEEFRGEFGALSCRGILGLPEGPSDPVPELHTRESMAGKPCPRCVRFAADALASFLEKQGG